MILLKKILGSLVRYGWTAIFAAPFVLKMLSAFLDADTIEALTKLGEPGGAIESWLWLGVMAIAPLLWSWYQKAIEVAKRWIAAHMPDTSLPKVEAEAKRYNPIQKVGIAFGKYPSDVHRNLSDRSHP